LRSASLAETLYDPVLAADGFLCNRKTLQDFFDRNQAVHALLSPATGRPLAHPCRRTSPAT
jgi:hypothetical protein